MERREFIKKSTLTAGAVMAGPAMALPLRIDTPRPGPGWNLVRVVWDGFQARVYRDGRLMRVHGLMNYRVNDWYLWCKGNMLPEPGDGFDCVAFVVGESESIETAEQLPDITDHCHSCGCSHG